jgi:hypothetical protein
MTSQRTHVPNLTVALDPPSVPARVWSPGNPEDGVDRRVELALLDSGTQVAVRDPRHPAGPALLFSLDGWNALLGQNRTFLDLR